MSTVLHVGIWLCLLVTVSSGVPIPECCTLISGSCHTACEQISLVSIALDPQDRHFRLLTLNQYCDKELTQFWSCINQSLEDIQHGEDWTGRPCCKLPQSQSCRYACLKAQDKSDLFQECRHSDEIGFFSCVEQLEVGEKCCANAQTLHCLQACQQVFASKQTPSRKVRNAVTHSCAYHSPKVIRCVQDYAKMTPANNPQRNLHCCEKASTDQCKNTCVYALQTKKTDQEIVETIEAVCGPPMPYDKLWQCFLHNADPRKSQSSSSRSSSIDRMGMDTAKLSCCWKATNTTCRNYCFKTYSNDWGSWAAFDRHCQSDLAEYKVVACLTELDEPCELGCEGLTYCTNFNDRPTELFQSCSLRADRAARKDVDLWKQHTIIMPNMQIPVVNIMQCDPGAWKAIACILQLKPCHPRRPHVAICRSDCISILSKCLDYERLLEGVTPESLCNVLAPLGDENSCISLAPYTVKSPVTSDAFQVTHPCYPNPCNVSEVCIVTRHCLPGQLCLPYRCVPGCRMGDISSLVVSQGYFLSIPPHSVSPGCQKVCRCSEHLKIEDCHSGSCIDIRNCWHQNRKIEHGHVFQLDCNMCICFSGELTCTRLSCKSNLPYTTFTGLPCNCASHYVPVCGDNGRTYSSACLARCIGLQESQLERVACSVVNPCLSNPCLINQRCIPKRSVCLSINKRSCKQFECININSDCALQPLQVVCDINHRQHDNACYLLKNNSILAYRGNCLNHCKNEGIACGQNGDTYDNECSSWADRILVDYEGPCIDVGTIQGNNYTDKCGNIRCPPLQVTNCAWVIPPGACCPLCAGAFELMFSDKHVDYLLSFIRYLDQITVRDIAEHLVRHIQSAECDVFAYLSFQGSIIVLVAPIKKPPTSLQAEVCVAEAEKLAARMERDSPLVAMDVLLSHLKTTQILHSPKSHGIAVKSEITHIFVIALIVASLSQLSS